MFCPRPMVCFLPFIHLDDARKGRLASLLDSAYVQQTHLSKKCEALLQKLSSFEQAITELLEQRTHFDGTSAEVISSAVSQLRLLAAELYQQFVALPEGYVLP